MSSNGTPKNRYKVPNKYLIRHVLGWQNGGSTVRYGSKTHVCRLWCYIYGLKQALCALFAKFHHSLHNLDFNHSSNDLSMFLHCFIVGTPFLLFMSMILSSLGLIVIIFKSYNSFYVSLFIWKILESYLFSRTWNLSFTSHIFFNQHKYTKDLIALVGLENSTPMDTLLEMNVKFSNKDGELLLNSTTYWQLVRTLI